MKTLTKFILNAAALSLALLFVQTASAQLMPNDLCANATTVTCGQTVSGNTNNSTIDTAPACGLTFPRYGVWYRFVGTGQTVTLSTCNVGTNYDTQIGVYSGSCTALSCVAGNNNDATCSRSGRYSTVTFNSVSGTTYYIWVTGVLSARGNFSMSVSCSGSVGVANDVCANAISMNCNSTVSGTTVGATSDAVGTCGTSLGTAPGVWYRFVGNGGSVTASLCGSGYDSKIGVFTGSCGALSCVAGNDDFCGLQSQVTFQSTAGTTYYVLVTGFSTAAGNFTLAVTCGNPPVAGDNDLCSATVPLLACGGTVTGTTATATTDAVPTCVTTLNTAPGRWYRFIGTGQNVQITTCNPGTNYDTKIGVFTGSCGAFTCVTGNDDGSPGGGQDPACFSTGIGFNRASTVNFASVNGTTYYVLITGFGTATGNFQMSATCVTTLNDTPDYNLTSFDVSADKNLMVSDFYPNPAQNGLSMMDINTNQDGEAVITLFDALGRIVADRQEGVTAGFNQVRLDVASLSAGTYFAVVNVNGEQFHKKLVVNR